MNYDYWLDRQLYLHDMEAERNERMQEEIEEQRFYAANEYHNDDLLPIFPR